MHSYDRLSVVVSLVLLGMVIALVTSAPVRLVTVYVFGSPLSVALSPQWIVGLILVGLTMAGTDYVLREHPRYRSTWTRHTFLFWILPVAVTITGILIAPRLAAWHPLLWIAGLLLTGFGLASVIVAEYRALSGDVQLTIPAQVYLNLVAYLVALLAFTAVYGSRTRSLLSGPAISLLAAVLSLGLLRTEVEHVSKTWAYSLTIGLVLGEITWVLNYWRISGLAGGAFLVVFFYLTTGLAQLDLWGRLNKRTVAEYAGVALLALLFLLARAVPFS